MSSFLIDTHTHIYSTDYENNTEQVQLAIDAGVQRMYLPNVDVETIPALLQICKQFPENCFPMLGLHPCSVKENVNEELEAIEKLLDQQPLAAIGEIGIDLYWDKQFLQEQIQAFETQIKWAIARNLPIVIHCREAYVEVMAVVERMQNGKLKGILHCFGGTEAEGLRAIEAGLLLGIGGVVTYKKSGLDIALANIPLDKIVLETDAPYLSPVPFRGKQNQSAYLPYIAQRLAEIKNVSLETITLKTTTNALELFSL